MDADEPLGQPELESTATLLVQVQAGDAAARERLVRRYLPALRRWARGRLPAGARDISDTDDLVQVTLLRALDKVETFESRHQGAFLAYLRRILTNEIRDQIRRAARRPSAESLPEEVAHDERSPVEQAIGKEVLEAYEAALERLPEEQREAVIMRVELEFTYREIAEALGKPTANSARMIVTRALARLAEVLHGV